MNVIEKGNDVTLGLNRRDMLIVARYFNDENDFLNLEDVSTEYSHDTLRDVYHYNILPDDSFFINTETRHFYNRDDFKNYTVNDHRKDYYQLVYEYPFPIGDYDIVKDKNNKFIKGIDINKENNPFKNSEGVVVLPEGIITLSRYCFENSPADEIVLPNSLKDIGERCFVRSKIERIIIPDSVTGIERDCFCATSNLTSVVLPTGIKEISIGCFWGSGIKSITIPEGVTRIGEGAFANCKRLKRADLPMSLIRIDTGAFSRCPIPLLIIPPKVKITSCLLYCDVDKDSMNYVLVLPEYTQFFKKTYLMSDREYDPNIYNMIRYNPYDLASLRSAIDVANKIIKNN